MKLPTTLRWLAARASVPVLILLALVAGFLLHAVLQAPSRPTDRSPVATKEQEAARKIKYWTCSMHPQIKQPESGACPICAMDLIPVTEGSEQPDGAGAAPTLTMSQHAQTIAEIQTTPVERRHPDAEIRLVGKVTYDETRLEDITAWVPGRLDRLFVDFTGVAVREGDHLISIYSPKLIAAQEELLQAIETERKLRQASGSVVKEATAGTVKAARDKLKLLGLKAGQVEKIEESGEPLDRLTIYAPTGGIVVEKHKKEGAYVDTGSVIYTIADLSHVWVKLDAYESDMMWLRYGQPVTVVAEAYPGEVFQGRIAFIDPVLNERTRTVKLRIDVPNPDARLKPGMFVRATVRPKVAAGGQVMEPELAGKWICRMHPGEISEEPGDCSVCGMPLVKTESVGYVPADAAEEPPLVIPASAPLITGTRAVVYVAVPDAEQPTYEGREIVLGPRAGDSYLVKSGLKEGENVVTQGNFKIDSALQIQAEPSMMNPPAEEAVSEKEAAEAVGEEMVMEVPAAFVDQVEPLLKQYFAVRKGLSSDDARAAAEAAKAFLTELDTVDMGLLEGPSHMAWMELSSAMKNAAGQIARTEDIAKQREAFSPFSADLVELVKSFGALADAQLYVLRCPMAFGGRGARWLQTDQETENPYYGSAMLRCGEVVERIAVPREQEKPPEEATDGE